MSPCSRASALRRARCVSLATISELIPPEPGLLPWSLTVSIGRGKEHTGSQTLENDKAQLILQPLSMTAVNVYFSSLYGVDSEGPLSYMLQIDATKVLLDCGWDDNFDVAFLEPLKLYADHHTLILTLQQRHSNWFGTAQSFWPAALGRVGLCQKASRLESRSLRYNTILIYVVPDSCNSSDLRFR